MTEEEKSLWERLKEMLRRKLNRIGVTDQCEPLLIKGEERKDESKNRK